MLARALVDRAVADRFLPFNEDFTAEDYHAVRDLMLEQMIADGEILPGQKVRFCRWLTREEDAVRSRKTAEAVAWSTPSEEAAAVTPPVEDEPAPCEGSDIEAELQRQFSRPIDEILPLPEGIV